MGFLDRFLGKKSFEDKESAYIEFIKELLERPKPPVKNPKTMDEFAKNVAAEFLVNSITVAKRNGSILMTTEDNSFEKAVKQSSIYEFIASEFPKTKMLSIKDVDTYNIIYPQGDLIYMLKSSADVSPAETKRIVQQLNSSMDLKAMDNILNAKVVNSKEDIAIVKEIERT